MNANQLSEQIGAIAQLADARLREAVIQTWLTALERGGHQSFDGLPVSKGIRTRSLLQHVNDVNALALYLLALAETSFGLKPDRDITLAGAILHDVDKAFILRLQPSGEVEYVDGYTMQDHGPAGAALALASGVAEKVCELVRTHAPFNYDGHLPGTVEGTIIQYADLTAFDLASNQDGVPPIHARSVILKRDHPLLRHAERIQSY
jgi:putative nucleotidyltransferase with HDIG domain